MKTNKTAAEIFFDSIIYAVVIGLCILTVYPFWNSLMVSISSRHLVTGGDILIWPKEIDLQSWKIVSTSSHIWQGFYNTVVRTALGTLLSIILSVMTAYPLSKKKFPHQKIFMGLIVFTMLFSGGLIPTYLLVKSVGLMNTIWALILPHAIAPFNVIILKNFFESIPESLEESAKIDGANEIFILFRIVLPLSTAVIATVTLWTTVGNWNSWFDAVLYLNDRSKMVLQQILREIIIQNQSDTAVLGTSSATPPLAESFQAAAMMFTTIPILLVYPFLQKYFTKGIMLGAVKG